MSDLVIPSSGHQTFSGLLIATPATFTDSALTVPPRALRRILVGAQTEERRLTKLAVGGPLGVDELGHELRPHPGRIFHARRWIEGGRLRSEPHELYRQHVEGLLRKAGAHLADVAKLRSVVEADEKRAEMLAAAFRRRVPADHEFGLLPHLDLAPEGRPNPRLVGRGLVLRDDPFPAEALGFAVRRLSIPDQPSRHEEGSSSAANEPLEPRSPLAQRTRHERPAVLLEEIEDRVTRWRRAGDSASLKELKARHALRVQGDELAVDDEIAIADGQKPRDDMRKSGGQVLKRPGPELHLPALATRDRADPVVLLLEDPPRSLDDARRKRREHRANEVQLGSPVAAFATSPPSSRAIPASSLRVSTERGFAVAMSTAAALLSLRFISSHLRSPVRTSVHEPLSFLPSSVKTMRPLRRASSNVSASSSRYVPMSHTITVPPPYSPSGITPSKRA